VPNARLIAVRLPDDLDARVRIEVARRSCTLSDFVRDAVRAEMDEPRLEPARPAPQREGASSAPKRSVRPSTARVAKAPRTICVHRVPVGSYCRRCERRVT
jgi:Arc/MetJ-type ribon-helix-helix transcriptional regulator